MEAFVTDHDKQEVYTTVDKVGDNVQDIVTKTNYTDIQISTKIAWLLKMLRKYPDASIIIFSSWYYFIIPLHIPVTIV